MVINETVTESTLFALTIEAIGTILSAIGNTPIPFLSQSLLYDIDNIGDILQVTGTGIQIDDERVLSLNKIGNIVIASGNLEEIAANFLFARGSALQQLLLQQGNAVQVVGTGLALVYSYEQTPNLANLYGLYANLLQIVGLSLQVLAGTLPSNSTESTVTNTIGNWIQAGGANLAVVSQVIENNNSDNNSSEDHSGYQDGGDKYRYGYYFHNHAAC